VLEPNTSVVPTRVGAKFQVKKPPTEGTSATQYCVPELSVMGKAAVTDSGVKEVPNGEFREWNSVPASSPYYMQERGHRRTALSFCEFAAFSLCAIRASGIFAMSDG